MVSIVVRHGNESCYNCESCTFSERKEPNSEGIVRDVDIPVCRYKGLRVDYPYWCSHYTKGRPKINGQRNYMVRFAIRGFVDVPVCAVNEDKAEENAWGELKNVDIDKYHIDFDLKKVELDE